jgi:hypothetical protein
MDDRWFTGRHRTGQVTFEAHSLEGGTLRIHDRLWEHTCLDLDSVQLEARERDQGSSRSDEPGDWETQVFALRKTETSWQVNVPATDHERWVADWKSALAQIEEFLQSGKVFPSAAKWLLANARHALDVLGTRGPGWMDLDPAISKLVHQHLVKR